MRKSWIFGGVALGALAVAALAVVASGWHAAPTPPPADRAEAVAAIDAAPPAATAEPREQAALPATPAVAATAPDASAGDSAMAVAAAPAGTLPALPTREIGEWRTHAVPEDAAPPPAKPLDLRSSGTPSSAGQHAATPPQGAEPTSAGPAFRPFAAIQLPTASGRYQPLAGGTPPAAQIRAAAPRGGAGPQIAGAAVAAGATALRIGGRPLQLFGIRPPASGDRCAAAGNTVLANGAQTRRTLPCQEEAQGILAARLAHKADISCRFPGAARADGPAICLDGDGVDLAGLLVAEGLALADPAESYDYVGAEGIARAQKRGLWLFR
jgi:endonuclease YncB( thermonuclease family)